MANSYYETELRAGFLKNLTTADKEAYTRAILSGVGIGGILALRNKIRQKQERQNREREEARRSQQFREPFQEFRARDKIIGMVSRASMAAEKLKKQRLFPKTTVKDGVTYRQNSILDTGLKSAKKAGAKAKAKFKTKKRNLKTAAKSALKPPLRQRRLRRGEAPPSRVVSPEVLEGSPATLRAQTQEGLKERLQVWRKKPAQLTLKADKQLLPPNTTIR